MGVVRASVDLLTQRSQGSNFFVLFLRSSVGFYSLKMRAFHESVWPGLTSQTDMSTVTKGRAASTENEIQN